MVTDGGTIRYRPKAAVTPELHRAMAKHKAGLLAELEVEAATAKLVEIERQIELLTTRAQEAEEAGNQERAAMLRVWAGELVRIDKMRLRRRQARALDSLGRLPDADRFLLEDPEDQVEVNGWRRPPTAGSRLRSVPGAASSTPTGRWPTAIRCTAPRVRSDVGLRNATWSARPQDPLATTRRSSGRSLMRWA